MKKGYYYNDSVLAVMVKFAKPGFNFQEIPKDFQKLKVFSDETQDCASQNKPILIVGASDEKLYKKSEEIIISAASKYNEGFLSRATVFYFYPAGIERLDFTL